MSIFRPTAHGSLIAALAVLATLAGPAMAQGKKGSGEGALGGIGSSKEPISIDADRLDVFDKEGRAVFTGNVVAVQGETNMRCTEMEVFYESKRGEKGGGKPGQTAAAGTSDAQPAGGGLAQDSNIKKILCKGPVTIKTAKQTATGDRAEFDRVANKVYLTGNATLADGPNVTRGQRVVYNLTTQVANVEGGRVRALIVPGSSDKEKPKGR